MTRPVKTPKNPTAWEAPLPGPAAGGTPPENYERFFVPAIGAPLGADLVDLAALAPNERVLDIACGTGIVARLAAERVGSAGTVTGVDINPAMLAVARATTPPAMSIEWHEASADALPLPAESYDVVFCQLGLQFVADKLAALREMRRVLAPDGRVLVNVPGPTPPVFAVLEDALANHVGPEAAAFVHMVFSLDDEVELASLMRGAGFQSVNVESGTKTLRLPAPEDFLWQYVHSTPLAGPWNELDHELRARIEREIVAEWQPFVDDGKVVVHLGMVVATAQK
jgi:ubiquinone/menaquinone biosynthesis C-methylase UbiE